MIRWNLLGLLLIISIGIVTVVFFALPPKLQFIDVFKSSSIFTRQTYKLPDPERWTRKYHGRIRNLGVHQNLFAAVEKEAISPKVKGFPEIMRQLESEKKQDGPGSNEQNNSDKGGKSNNDKNGMQGGNADSHYGNKNNGGGPDEQRNSNENVESSSSGANTQYTAGESSGENSTTTYSSSDQTDYSALTAKSYNSSSSKAGIWFFLFLGATLIGSAFVFILHSARKRKRYRSAHNDKSNRGGIDSDQISDWFDKISDAYIAMEQIATDSYTDVKSRFFYTASPSVNRHIHRVKDVSGESSSEGSVVSSLSGESIDYGSKDMLRSPFELASDKLKHDITDLDSISVCIKTAREGTKLPYGINEELGRDDENSPQPLFIHYVPL